MISQKLLTLIVNNESRLAKRWSEEVRKSDYMKTYQRFSEEELIRRNTRFFDQLVRWLESNGSKSLIGAFFVQIGKDRYKEKFPLPEMLYGVFLAKKVFWDVIVTESFLDTMVDVYKALEALTLIYNFFDQGNLYITRGYLEEMYTEMIGDKKLSAEEIKKYFHPGSFFKLDLPFDVASKK
ncbi:MAG: RsbRD N-terminal domain-containing protein [Desulfobacterota bacterium]|nr:RsbRD N-terminal domain-containing protein [Thermodesulfobacteriota bacterium]